MTYHAHVRWGQTMRALARMQRGLEPAPGPEPCPYRIGGMILATVVLPGTFLAVVAGATASRECREVGGRWLAGEGLCLRRDAVVEVRRP
jgi:hypothetical protein